MIEPGLYEIEILSKYKYSITPLQNVNPTNIKNIDDLITSLAYASLGYKDCEMPLDEYDKLMSHFYDPITKEVMSDFK